MLDALEHLTGTTLDPTETVTATKTTPYVIIGSERAIQAVLRVAGTVSGTSPTLDVTIKAASDAAGTGAVVIATFPQVTATHLSAVLAGTQPLKQVGSTPAGKPYVAATLTVGGTTPSFGGTSIVLQPAPGGTAV